MKTVSNSIKTAISKPTTQRKGRIKVNNSYYDIYNVEYYSDCYNEGTVVGNAIASQLDFDIPYINKFDNFVYYDGIWTGSSYEYIEMGEFTVFDEKEVDEFKKHITAFDNLIKFNVPYVDRITYPTTLYNLLKDICLQAGVLLNNVTIPNNNFSIVDNQFVNNESLKTVLKSICGISGTYAVIKNNKLNLQLKNSTTVSIDKSYHGLVDWKRRTYGINQVIIGMENVEGEYVLMQDDNDIALNGVHKLVINDNYFAYTQEKRQQLITGLYNQVHLFGYMPYELKGEWLSYMEIGDSINIDGNDTIILRVNAKSPNSVETEMSAPAIIDSSKEYSNNTNDINNRIQRTEVMVDKQNQTITSIAEKQTENTRDIAQLKLDNQSITSRVESVETKADNTVKSITPYYAVSTSKETAPTTGWDTSIPIRKENEYLWRRDKITLNDNTSFNQTAYVVTGDKGNTGSAGNGISSINYYYKTTTTQTAPSASDITSTSIPKLSATDKYLWQKEVINYTVTTTPKTTVSLISVYGDNGTSVSIKSTSTKYQESTSGTTIPTGSWVDNPTSTQGKYLWTRVIVEYNPTGSTTSYSVSYNGNDGEKGDIGLSVKSIVPMYYLSTSRTAQTGGSWTTTIPEYELGKYYWTRITTTYSDNTSNYSTPALDMALTTSSYNSITALDTANSAEEKADDAITKLDTFKTASGTYITLTDSGDYPISKIIIDGTYEPQGTSSIDITTCNKNLLNLDDIVSYWECPYTKNNGIYSLTALGHMVSRYKLSNLQENEIYTISCKAYSQSSTNPRIEIMKDGSMLKPIRLDAGGSYSFTVQAGSIYEIRGNCSAFASPFIINNLQLEKGYGTPYEEHKETSIKIDLGDEFLAKLNDEVKDELIQDGIGNVKIVKRIGKNSEGYYELSNPYEVDLGKYELLNTFDNITHITQSNLESNMEVTYQTNSSLNEGYATKDDISGTIDMIQDVQDKFKDYVTTENFTSELNVNKTNILSEVSHTYVASNDLEQFKSEVNTRINQKADSVQIQAIANETVTNAISGIESTINNVEENFTFDTNGLTIGRSTSDMNLNLQNDRLAFKVGNQEKAYMSSNEFSLGELVQFKIGNFAFVPRSNGSVDFKKVG